MVAYSILVSAPVPFGLDLIGTLLGFGLGLGGFGTKGLGTGLDKIPTPKDLVWVLVVVMANKNFTYVLKQT